MMNGRTISKMETNDKTMSNNKQSSVEWFVEELTKQNMFMNLFSKEIEQAKAMHKEEIEASYADGYSQGYKRVLELVKWKIDNELKQDNEQQ